MCDALSWGIMMRNVPEKGLKCGQRIGPLTDDEIIAKWGEGVDFDDKCGHSALAEYYGLHEYRDFSHQEDAYRIPRPIVKEVNAGKFRRIYVASKRWYNVHYRADGTLARYTLKARECLPIWEVRENSDLFIIFSDWLRQEFSKYQDFMVPHLLKVMNDRGCEHSHLSWDRQDRFPINEVVDRLICFNEHSENFGKFNSEVSLSEMPPELMSISETTQHYRADGSLI